MSSKNTVCLWFDGAALEAARFYEKTFPDSAVGAVYRAPADYPAGKQGDVLTVAFTVMGIPCLGLNGGPGVAHSMAFSFQVATDDQAETDRLCALPHLQNGGNPPYCNSFHSPDHRASRCTSTHAMPNRPLTVRGDAPEWCLHSLVSSCPHSP